MERHFDDAELAAAEQDVDGHWRVSLTPEFLALETTKYTSHGDFFQRLKALAAALDEHFEPGQLDRRGVRYIDRVMGSAVDDIAKLVRPEVRGITGTTAAVHALHAISESMFDADSARVLAAARARRRAGFAVRLR